MERLLVSACLLGHPCKYSGGDNRMSGDALRRLKDKYILIPVCPETAGGLGVPRAPSERRGARVHNSRGEDVTAQYRRGAETAVRLAARFDCQKALLKERSPSCGNGRIYDGSFSGRLTEGMGVAAERLREAGLTLYGESQWESLV